jgi:hypothetical protein
LRREKNPNKRRIFFPQNGRDAVLAKTPAWREQTGSLRTEGDSRRPPTEPAGIEGFLRREKA